MGGFWVGADPGGKGDFGLAFLDDDTDQSNLITVSSVEEAVKHIADRGQPRGLGVDGPLWWSTRSGAGRKVDESLRRNYKIHPGTVQSANSLRGAALVGGAMLVKGVREKFRDVAITECHPKAFLEAGKVGLDCCVTDTWSVEDNEHKRDALICAICAREGVEQRWKTDLASDRWPEEENPLSRCFRLGPVHYYWPERLQ